jgi:Tfp pilus assembly protein PilX
MDQIVIQKDLELFHREARNLMNRKTRDEKGVALIMALILVLVMSVMAISLMFISQSETWSSLNYRLMAQARDGAEAGINSTSNYIVNSYAEPGTTSSYNEFSLFPVTYASGVSGDPTTAYNLLVSPVQYPSTFSSGHDVILSANSSQASNYPVSAVQSAFNTNGVGYGSITSGNNTITYNSYAKLMAMHSAFTPFGSTSPTTVQTWKLTSVGSISGVRGATVAISATLEQHVNPTFNYAAFATDTGCSALQFGGGGTTNSYDHTAALSGGRPVTSSNTGNVGTNGNLATNGNPTVIYGTLSTPRSGVGSCTSSNVTAWTDSSGHLQCSATLSNAQCMVELPQTVVYPTPTIPAAGTVDITSNSSCPTMTGTGGTCVKSGSIMTLAPSTAGGTMSLHTLSLTGNKDLHLAAGTYNIDSLSETGNTGLVLDSVPVILNVTGSGGGTVVDLTGGSVTNTSGNFDPMSFQVLYAGTGTVSLKGGNNSVGLLYAPNATFSFGGNADWYGAVIGKDMTDMGGTAVHYDRQLANEALTVGPWMLDSFSWKKY